MNLLKRVACWFLLVVVMGVQLAYTQENRGILPPCMTVGGAMAEPDMLTLRPPATSLIRQLEAETQKAGLPLQIGITVPVHVSVRDAGTWTRLADGRPVWRLQLTCSGAVATVLYFDEFALPPHASLFVYNADTTMILGPFTDRDNPKGEEYSIGYLTGETVTVEYYPPDEADEADPAMPQLTIESLLYIYRDEGIVYRSKGSGGYGESGDCMVNVNCAEGRNWTKQKAGVARILLRSGNLGSWCTGTVINNTANDGTPYFLTADHCGNVCSAADLNQWKFYFNYESDGCSSDYEPAYDVITGCTQVARSPIDGGTDFKLLRLNTTARDLANIGVVYNGWTRTTQPANSGVCIHHPMGDIKKISTYTQQLRTFTYDSGDIVGADGAHWQVFWSSTDNGFGVTEGGSSGAPLFNGNGLVVGALSGGTTDCTRQEYYYDLYGKLAMQWDGNGNSANDRKLQPWLDPQNTGAVECQPHVAVSAAAPIADFHADRHVLEHTGTTVTFYDDSQYAPTQWLWTFGGGTPSTSIEQNPRVTYNVSGTYDVKLTVSNAVGSNTITRAGYITFDHSGVDDCSSAGIVIAPNPTTGLVDIDLPMPNAQLTLRNAVGNVVATRILHAGNNSADFSNLTPGLYVVDIQADSKIYSQKLIIK